MTAAFAIGQIAGPLAAWALGHAPLAGWSAIEATLALAAALLCATALWLSMPSTLTETAHELSPEAD
jgi:hypothetical protein